MFLVGLRGLGGDQLLSVAQQDHEARQTPMTFRNGRVRSGPMTSVALLLESPTCPDRRRGAAKLLVTASQLTQMSTLFRQWRGVAGSDRGRDPNSVGRCRFSSAPRAPGHNALYVCDPSDHRSAHRLALAQAISLTVPMRPSGRLPSPPSTPRRPLKRRKKRVSKRVPNQDAPRDIQEIKGLERICC